VSRALEEIDWLKGKKQLATTTDMSSTLDEGKVVTPPFLFSLWIFGKNLHNCLLDSGALGNVMPFSICKNLGLTPTQTNRKFLQLDKTKVNVVGELKNVHI
jgi:hypothetical protein